MRVAQESQESRPAKKIRYIMIFNTASNNCQGKIHTTRILMGLNLSSLLVGSSLWPSFSLNLYLRERGRGQGGVIVDLPPYECSPTPSRLLTTMHHSGRRYGRQYANAVRSMPRHTIPDSTAQGPESVSVIFVGGMTGKSGFPFSSLQKVLTFASIGCCVCGLRYH